MFRNVCLFAIEGYQRFASPFLGMNCRYYPSCSEYAKQVYLFQNPFIATFKTLGRILSCNQFFEGGVAYPNISISLQVNVFKPCLVKYWLIPYKEQSYIFQNIPINRMLLNIQLQAFQVIKNYSKVSRV
ncbi:membrane protein insertion efficiency factor YidD [Helicobacter sp. MIT 11-5569]|uniref:membrane protein insertion efficiency factor YidD n=1 Tax=Helicobacter sp. MIT 11-5569 TaxID=1548151 RepID=UPI0006897D1F|nr:membrane protein insertion efficiency factor YidD [Helicobacter sp. MIT 11-5569]TLD85343.1 membrane protein insertion efficiency factor YidD [Helicobacter sp. MIT 11-5569]